MRYDKVIATLLAAMMVLACAQPVDGFYRKGLMQVGGAAQVLKLAVGANGSALPTARGCVTFYTPFTEGDYCTLDFTGCGNADAGDYFAFKHASTGFWDAYNSAIGAGTITGVNAVNGGEYRDAIGTGPSKHTHGWWTPAGKGGAIGAASAAVVPQTGALDFGAATFTAPGDGVVRVMQGASNTIYVNIDDSGGMGASVAVGTINATGYQSAGAAAYFPVGAYTASNKGIGIGTSAPAGNWLAIKKGTDPLVGIADCNVLFTRSADEFLVTTAEGGLSELVALGLNFTTATMTPSTTPSASATGARWWSDINDNSSVKSLFADGVIVKFVTHGAP